MFNKPLTLSYLKELIQYEIMLAKIRQAQQNFKLLTGKLRSIARSFTLRINI